MQISISTTCIAAMPLPNFDRQCLTAKDVDHGQGAEFLAVAQLIMHKIQAPSFIGAPWCTAILCRFGRLPRKTSPSSQ
jgi:hypothetical protein